MNDYKLNTKYKDRLFRLIFHEKKELLELYNAVNESDYTNPEELEITTIEDVVYMGMRNDLSFIIGDEMNLYEHQRPFVRTFHCVDCFIFHLYTKPILNRRSISYIPLRNLRFLFHSILYFIMGLRKSRNVRN